jgi:NAD(P)-dependent dehydrogenase (short-subunit alcohol dehydrogenase family)
MDLAGKSYIVTGGAIVAVSSAAAVIANPYGAEYSAPKAGINGLVRTAAIEYANQGIRINAILPGATDTPLVVEAMARNPRNTGMPIPMKRMASPGEVASSEVWLLSDSASYVTGCCMCVDGGMTVA